MRLLTFLLVFLLLGIVGCMKDEDYTTSITDTLSFSKDTVRFDTIISGEPTRTYNFTVYNKANKALRISQVALAKGGNSPFKVNVDGVPLEDGSASDFEIAKKDSMIVYLMANVPTTDSDQLAYYEDELCFTTEAGVQQKVVLNASGQNVVTLQGQRITTDVTLTANRPYRVMDSLVVGQGATLTLEAGATLLFHQNASLIVYGRLKIEGSTDQPVTLRGDRMDNMFEHQPYNRTPGLWGGVVIKSDSYDNYIDKADIHSGKFGIRVDSSDVSKRKLTIENSAIHTVTGHALDVRMSQVKVGNSQLTNAGGDCIHLRGGDATFIHCTIGRFYVFSGGSGHALNFANVDGDVRLPISRLYFANSIITGYQDDEIMGSEGEEGDEFNYLFTHCLLNTPVPKSDDIDAHFISCLWDQKSTTTNINPEAKLRDKNFLPDFNLDYLLFSFGLNKQSQAVGTADAVITQANYPKDKAGNSRSSQPDMGCFQHQESADNDNE